MKSARQKALFALIICVVNLFAACGPPSLSQTEMPTGDAENSFELFKAEVEYDSYAPAGEISLPVSDVSGCAQIEKTLYLTDGSAVYSLSLETGESSRLFEAPADAIASDGEGLYLLDSRDGEISLFSSQGEKLQSFFGNSLVNLNILGFEATENRLVVFGDEKDGLARKIITLNKKNGTVEAETNLKPEYKNICAYAGKKILITYLSDGSDSFLYSFDAESGRLEKLRKILAGAYQIDCKSACYNPKADSVILAVPFGDGKISLVEYRLDSEDNAVLARFDCDGNFTGRRVTVYENILSAIVNKDNYQYFDYDNPPPHITVAYADLMGGSAGADDLEKIIASYEADHDVIVRTAVYSDDAGRLELKLMAGDGDIDIFSSASVGENNCIKSGIYADLKKFNNLNQKISANTFTDFAAKAGEDYFGLPYEILYRFKSENKNPEPTSAIQAMSLKNQSDGLAAIYQYCIKNIDFEAGEFRDADGNELYKALKYHYENPQGAGEPLYDFDFSIIQCSYLIINPKSEKQELAADFLEYFFDAMSGNVEIKPILTTNSEISLPFLPLNSTENVYLSWRVEPSEAVETVVAAYNKAAGTDGSKKALKALAEEAAKGLRMRMGG